VKNNSEGKIWIPLLFSIASIIGLVGGYKMAGNEALKGLIVKTDSLESSSKGRVEELVRFIESRYVADINTDELIEDAFTNILEHLDPHSIYLKPEDMQQLNDQMGGSFEGIGIESILLDDTLYINHVIAVGPAREAGLSSGDQIISINNESIAGQSLSFSEMRSKLKGERGDHLNLGIRDFDTKEIRSVDLEIGNVDIKSVSGFRLDDEFAVVQIQRFSSDTYKEFMDCLSRLQEEGGFKSLILDLRGNPGGFLPEATKILNQIFKEKGRLLVYTQGRNERVSEYKSTGKNFYDIDKVAILVDEGSASGSEIMAGAIQDWDRGLIVGRRTFGKGLVQEQYDLSNGGALRLTVAEYFTPTGRLIQKSYADKEVYRDDIANRIQSGELLGSQESPIMDSTVFKTKINKRAVFAGGGITPDVFIPLDSAQLSMEAVKIYTEKAQFIFEKFLKGELNITMDSTEFLKNWEVPDEMIAEFRSLIGFSNIEDEWLDPLMRKALKSEIAKLYFGKVVELEANLSSDEFVLESISALSKQNIFAELK
jgi:carboxyl-terminal processing protease